MKWVRESFFRITFKFNDSNYYEIVKDLGSMERSKPFYCVIWNDRTIAHVFSTQKAAKLYVQNLIGE